MMYSMQRFLVGAVLPVLIALAGASWNCAQAQPQQASADNAALRRQLETTYQQVRAALKTNNYDAFVALYEHPAGKPLPKSQWPEASESLSDMLPEFSKMRFIRLVPDDDWAGYFFQELDNDANYVTVSLFRFHRAGQGWKFNGAAQSNSFRKNKTAAEDNAEIQQWIESNKKIKSPKR